MCCAPVLCPPVLLENSAFPSNKHSRKPPAGTQPLNSTRCARVLNALSTSDSRAMYSAPVLSSSASLCTEHRALLPQTKPTPKLTPNHTLNRTLNTDRRTKPMDATLNTYQDPLEAPPIFRNTSNSRTSCQTSSPCVADPQARSRSRSNRRTGVERPSISLRHTVEIIDSATAERGTCLLSN